MSDHALCYVVDNPGIRVYGHVSDADISLRTTRRVAFSRYRAGFLDDKAPIAVYENTEDLLEPALRCAQTILANECPIYVAAYRRCGPTTAVSREMFEHFGAKRYTQVVSTQA